MKDLMIELRQQWMRSARFRALTIIAFVLMLISLASTTLWNVGLFSVEGVPPANDLQIYLEAGRRFGARQGLYISPRPDFGLYAYSPAFAAAVSPLTLLPYNVVLLVDLLLHIIAYWILYWRWFLIFRYSGHVPLSRILIRFLPLWLVFTGILYEFTYLNIYIFMALLATLFIEAVLNKKTGLGILCLAVMLPIKPQWAFTLGLPLLFKHWRFLFHLVLGGLLSYLVIFGLTAVLAGRYALDQYLAYFRFLPTISSVFYWNTLANQGHIGYNNSLMQLVFFFSNQAPYGMVLSQILKALLIIPLALLGLDTMRRPHQESNSVIMLEWSFALYLGAFLLLDVLTELTFGIVIYIFLLGTLQSRFHLMVHLVFLPYALTSIWVITAGLLSLELPLPMLLVDPSLFFPFILLALLGMYAIILRGLWVGRKSLDSARPAE